MAAVDANLVDERLQERLLLLGCAVPDGVVDAGVQGDEMFGTEFLVVGTVELVAEFVLSGSLFGCLGAEGA